MFLDYKFSFVGGTGVRQLTPGFVFSDHSRKGSGNPMRFQGLNWVGCEQNNCSTHFSFSILYIFRDTSFMFWEVTTSSVFWDHFQYCIGGMGNARN